MSDQPTRKDYPCGASASGGLMPLPDTCPFHGPDCDTLEGLHKKLGNIQAALREAQEQRDNLSTKNTELCSAHNALLADGARWQTRAEKAEAECAAPCKHCGHDPQARATYSVAVDQPGNPVAAPCTLEGCQFAALQAAFCFGREY